MDAARAGFEAAIIDNPQERANWQAYADWLSERGDPHGELMQVQLALEDEGLEPGQRQQLQERFRAILREHHAAIIGPLWNILPGVELPLEQLPLEFGPHGEATLRFESHEAYPLNSQRLIPRLSQLVLRRGWIQRADNQVASSSQTQALCRSPAARLLQDLVVTSVNDETAAVFQQASFLSCLRRFEAWGPFETSCRGMSRLEELACVGWNKDINTLLKLHPGLTSLTLHGFYGEELAGLEDAPELLQLVRLSVRQMGTIPVAFLRLPGLRNVRHLTVLGDPAAVAAVQASGIANQLESLRIEGGDFFEPDSGELLTALAARPGLKFYMSGVSMSPEVETAVRSVAPTAEIKTIPRYPSGTDTEWNDPQTLRFLRNAIVVVVAVAIASAIGLLVR